MARTPAGDPTDTGIILSDQERLPIPTSRESAKRIDKNDATKRIREGTSMKALVAVGVLALAGGAAGGFAARPQLFPDARIATLEKQNADTERTATTQKDRADALAKELDASNAKQEEIKQQLTVTEKKKDELEDVAAASKAEQDKLKTALDKAGDVTTNGDEITLQLVDKVLFKLGDDQLTPAGQKVLARVGQALNELPDKQIWVQGHTDDTPIVVPPAPKKLKKGEAPPVAKFATNWELSAARALTVVHYLQDEVNVDPTRLAALAFGQYRPVSRGNKALNRRIEIVLYPKKAKLKK
ncbi:MAG TPA: OmpA family protein [Kofleriaceae bacterium]|jgi:chemotaxis protein MotB